MDETLDLREPHISGGRGQHARAYARDLRLTLSREHFDRPAGDDADLCDPRSAFAAFARTAAALDTWHTEGRPGQRPPGRLRAYQTPNQSWWTRTWATPLYRCLYDPDGRPPALRRTSTF